MADKQIGKRKYYQMSSKTGSVTQIIQNHRNSSKIQIISITSLPIKAHFQHQTQCELTLDDCFKSFNTFPSLLEDFTYGLESDDLNFENKKEDETIEVWNDLYGCDGDFKCFEWPVNFTGEIV